MRRRTQLTVFSSLLGLIWLVPASAEAAVVRCHGVVATIVGDGQSELITGTDHRDVIAALGGSDSVDGRGGNDLICGGAGNDRLNGGAGNDTMYGGRDRLLQSDEGTTEKIGDVLEGGAGDDRLTPGHDTRAADDVSRDVVSWAASPRRVSMDLEAGVVTGQGRDVIVGRPISVVGSGFGDVILGSDSADRIEAGGGSDEVHARRGDDVVSADATQGGHGLKDRIWGGAGADQLSAADGDDLLRGGKGDDVLDDFGEAADRLYGGPGDDLIVTELVLTSKPQIVDGGPGTDRVNLMTNLANPHANPATGTWNMATGDLDLTVDYPLTATVRNVEDADLSTYGTAWTITGSDRKDVLRASGTRGTTFTALGGDDQFSGSSDADMFDGGTGNDRSLTMGDGNDTCVSVEVFDYPDCENIS